MNFLNVERLVQLHELENSFRSMSKASANDAKRFDNKKIKAMILARSWAFWGAANLVAELIQKNDRLIK